MAFSIACAGSQTISFNFCFPLHWRSLGGLVRNWKCWIVGEIILEMLVCWGYPRTGARLRLCWEVTWKLNLLVHLSSSFLKWKMESELKRFGLSDTHPPTHYSILVMLASSRIPLVPFACISFYSFLPCTLDPSFNCFYVPYLLGCLSYFSIGVKRHLDQGN